MSHIGKQPIVIPEGVKVIVEGNLVRVEGPKGTLEFAVPSGVEVRLRDTADNPTAKDVVCEQSRPGRESRALWGTTRARIANMVHGVNEGWQKQLELVGVGYRASLKGTALQLTVGFSHPVVIEAPEGITFAVDKEQISVSGADNQVVGQMAAVIREVRPPEPYKGKGIRYVGEHVRRKVGKVVGATT